MDEDPTHHKNQCSRSIERQSRPSPFIDGSSREKLAADSTMTGMASHEICTLVFDRVIRMWIE